MITNGIRPLLQILQEVTSVLDFLKEVYTTFGFTFQCNLATRPEKFMGDPALWDNAEKVENIMSSKIVYVQCER